MSTKVSKVIGAFLDGEEMTGKQIAHRFRVGNYRAMIHSLRSEGYSIYRFKNVDTKGRVKTKYTLGMPSREVIAAGITALGAKGAGLI